MSAMKCSPCSWLVRLSFIMNRLTEWILFPVAVVFVSIIFVAVLTRYVFHHPIVESVELARLAFIWTMLLACAIGVFRHAHVAIYNLRNCLSKEWRSRIAILVYLICAGFGSLMFWYGIKLATRVWQTSFPSLGWSQGWLYIPLAISGGLIVLHGLSHAVAAISADQTEETQP